MARAPRLARVHAAAASDAPGEIHQQRGLHQPEVHGRDEALPAGQEFGVIAVLGLEGQGFVHVGLRLFMVLGDVRKFGCEVLGMGFLARLERGIALGKVRLACV